MVLSIGNSQHMKVDGNMIDVKGHKYLIDAAHMVIKRIEDVGFIVLGNSDENSREISFFGPKPHDEIPLWMNAADIFVLPSLNEGNPTVMFEALACGKPFVGTTVGGIPEIITNEKLGLLVPPANSQALAEAIIRALGTEWDTNYILKYAERFTWKNIAKQILDLYSNLITSSKNRAYK